MFCKNCGKELANDAKFCDACGATMAAPAVETPVQQAPVQQVPVQQVPVQQVPVQPQVVYVTKAPNPMITNFVDVIKNFWANPVAAIGKAAKSVTHEWVLLALIGIIAYALGTAVVGVELANYLLGALSAIVGEIFPFFGIFGVGLLVGAAAYFATAAGLWILVSMVFKKQATFIQSLNMTAVAALPLAAIHILNMLFGLIYAPITFALFIVALIMSVVLLYTGTQKFDKLDKSPFYGFSIVLAIVVIVSMLLGSIYLNVIGSAVEDGAMNMLGGLMGGIGDLSENALGGMDMEDLF